MTVTSFLTHEVLIFQPYLCEDSKYLGQSEIFVCIYVHSLGKNPKYSGNSLALVYFCYRIQQDPLLLLRNTPNIHQIQHQKRLQTSTRKGISQILRLITQSSSEMAKFAIPAQETPKSLGQSLCHCMLIEKLIKIFRSNFSARQRHTG